MLIALVFIIHARPQEENILQFWKETDAFKEQLRRSEGRPQYVFYDGPPFATGLPHYGHILAGTIKDVVTRFACSTGHHVTRRLYAMVLVHLVVESCCSDRTTGLEDS